MRNSRIPIDEIARAIRNDDVDTLQKIISQNSISLDGKIPNDIFNIYKNMTYIDYAAYYGALKCFKYLLLNKAKINTCTLAYSVASGNIEIIRNIKAIKQDVKPKAAPQGLRLATGAGLGLDIGAGAISPLSMAIAHHYNDIFDWLFEQEFADSKNDVKYDKIIISAAQNCNIHAIIKCIEHGLDISLIPNPTLQSFLFAIFSNGYFRLFQNLLYLYPNIMSFNSTPSQSNFYSPTVKSFLKFSSVRNTYLSNLVISGSLSFLKIYLHSVNSINNNMITTAFLDSAEQGYFDIFKFFFNELPNWKPTLAQIENAVVKALENMNYDIVLYLFNNSEYKPNHRVLDIACKSNKFEIVKIITNFILKQYPKSDFTSAFYIAALNGSFDICKFFAEKQVFLDFGILENKAQSIVKSGDKDILFLLMDIADPEEKELFLADCLDQAIQGGNKEIVEYILSQDVSIDNALFTATQLERLEIIKLIVEKNNSPSYINSISPEGTAISIAIQKKNLEIVKYFLSIPGINLDIYQKDHKTPLMVAAEMRDWEITNLIINFYGDKIHSQLWQVNESIKILLRKTHSRHIQRTQILSGNSLSQSFPRPGVSLLKKSISDYTIDEDLSIMKILNLFLKIKNVDINVIENGQTILSYACEKNHTELVNNLLKYKEIDVNQYLPDNGDTALMAAIREKSTETVEILLKLPNININHQNYQSETALTIAAEKSLIEIIKLLTSHKNFDPEINRLSYAFGNCLHLTNKDSANELIKTPNINVNKRIIIGKSILTPLVISVQKGFDDFVQLIIDHPTFDPVKSLTRTALFEAVQKDNANIFQLLLPFSPTSVNIKDKKNRTLLTVAARSSSQNIIPLIITNSDFDSQKSEIDVALTESYDKVPILNLLYELTNIDFTQTLPDGRTFLTAISYKNEKSLFALQFLLEKGADPNSMDLSGNLPLAMAIQAKNLLFISELINSEKIDLKLPLENNNSYLHLAAEQNVEIFQMIHQKNIIDINSVNDFGETSMFNAIRCRKKDIITFMFGIPEFDYQKLNFNNEDALDVASSLFSKKFDKMNYEKDAYLALLLKLIS
ncbi:hypothetical protein TRFO_28020 [Tritrichomonas foetus]|uniref:Uncharacterized protein n=1 Tax=Tritrichomonas foetus TaxID=1144522 RepID=A0A1J4JZU9_9EUKA|nr:hypothetical protein TRFO_28020 [Tritrichomonas foetus]|eukprot:OHT04507.1 hypothetical protein TRFO_28020 [Tritrichomonas foetus]